MIMTVDIAWTRGSPYDANVQAPAVNGYNLPVELDKAHKAEEKCVKPLPESRIMQVISTSNCWTKTPLICG